MTPRTSNQSKDIQSILIPAMEEVFVTKKEFNRFAEKAFEVFVTKEDLIKMQETIREDFSNLLTAVDKYSQKADTYFQEMVMLSHKIDRHEQWIQQIADKVGVRLKV